MEAEVCSEGGEEGCWWVGLAFGHCLRFVGVVGVDVDVVDQLRMRY